VGFKGGSEPGVLTGTWLMHRTDGRQFMFSIAFYDTEQPIDTPTAVAAMEAARDAVALIS
jgi:tRNA(His) 5'-end guanylyltransferase